MTKIHWMTGISNTEPDLGFGCTPEHSDPGVFTFDAAKVTCEDCKARTRIEMSRKPASVPLVHAFVGTAVYQTGCGKEYSDDLLFAVTWDGITCRACHRLGVHDPIPLNS